MSDVNWDSILTPIIDEVIERAQRNIGATRRVKYPNGKTRNIRINSTGRLKDSLGGSFGRRGGNIVITMSAGGAARKYFAAVNDGRPAGKMPPLNAIGDWMKSKPIRLRGASGRLIPNTVKNFERAKWAIAKGIEKRGIPAKPYYTEAIEDVVDEKGEELAKLISENFEILLKTWQ